MLLVIIIALNIFNSSGFLDIPNKANKKMNWLFNDIIINDTFINLSNSNEMVLSKNFDGSLFIDKTSIPEKK